MVLVEVSPVFFLKSKLLSLTMCAENLDFVYFVSVPIIFWLEIDEYGTGGLRSEFLVILKTFFFC